MTSKRRGILRFVRMSFPQAVLCDQSHWQLHCFSFGHYFGQLRVVYIPYVFDRRPSAGDHGEAKSVLGEPFAGRDYAVFCDRTGIE